MAREDASHLVPSARHSAAHRRVMRAARALAAGVSASVMSAGVAVGYGLALGARPCACEREKVSGTARDAAYARLARSFDDAVGGSEYWSGIERMRATLVRERARGDVLEVACGTGRNFAYYDARAVRSLRAMDACEEMVAVARTKPCAVRLAVERGDAQAMSKVKSASVDVVVDTFGLCSFDDPVGALREMARVTKSDGRVLLIEHGRSEYGWLNNILDHFADAHAAQWGCYWNRPIMKLIDEAGLEVLEKTTTHLGTTFVVVAKPKR